MGTGLRGDAIVERYPHPNGVEYAVVQYGRILGTVVPHGHNKLRQRLWRCFAKQIELGIFSGRWGRQIAYQRIQNFHQVKEKQREPI